MENGRQVALSLAAEEITVLFSSLPLKNRNQCFIKDFLNQYSYYANSVAVCVKLCNVTQSIYCAPFTALERREKNSVCEPGHILWIIIINTT